MASRTKGSDNGKSRPAELSITSPKWLHRRPPMKLRTPSSRKPSKKVYETMSDIEPRLPQEFRRTERNNAILEGLRKSKKVKDVKAPERQKIVKEKVTTPTRSSPRKPNTTQQKPNTTQQKPPNSPRPTQAETNPPRPPSSQRPPSSPSVTSSATISDLRVPDHDPPHTAPVQPAAAPAEKRKKPSKSSEQQKLPYKTKKRKTTNPATVRNDALIADLTAPAAVVPPPAVILCKSPCASVKLPVTKRLRPSPIA